MSFKTIIISYLIGGLTLPPLLIIAALYLYYTVLPRYVDDDEIDDKDDDLSEFTTNEYENLKMTEVEEKQTSGVKAFKSGWLTVTREYHTFVNNANDKQLEGKEPETKSAYSSLYRLMKSNKKQAQQSEAGDDSASSATGDKATKKIVRRKNRYFGVLRHGNLFLYKDDTQQDVQHVIVLSNNIVTLWPRDLGDAELFTKRSAICILKRQSRRKSDLPPKESSASLRNNEVGVESTIDILKSGIIPPKNKGFFIYCDTNYEKEDWYFELIKATKRDNFQPTNTDLDLVEPSIYANALHFKTADIISLIQTLHSSEGQLQTRWLNALIGRIFLSVQFTEYFHNVVHVKLLKKLTKINKPGFLDEIRITKVDVGNAAPFISFPKLIELNPDGSLKLGMKFSYTGKISLQVATKMNYFKSREVSILLAATINKIEGPMIVHVKPPPSTRIWYTFETMPTVEMDIEPVVSDKQITSSMIRKMIEGKFKDGIKDSLVLPHWDDITFFNTSEEIYRGGIWDTTKRPDDNDTAVASEAEKAEILNEEDDLSVDVDLTETIDSDSKSDIIKLESDITDSKSPNFEPRDNNDDFSSLRSRNTTASGTVRSRGSFTNSISSGKKTTPSIVTSSEQFLSNGDYVSKDISAPSSPVKEAKTFTASTLNKSEETLSSEKEKSFSRSNTIQILSEEASASKKTIQNSIKKIGKWYNDKNRNGSSATFKHQDDETSSSPSTTTKPYTPPEMIQSRRKAPSTSEGSKRQPRRTTSTNTLNSQDSGSMKAAPQAHTFPAEYLSGLEPSAPDSQSSARHVLPPKNLEMKSPYESMGPSFASPVSPPKETSPTSPNKSQFPRRKPVSEDHAAQVPSEDQKLPPPLPERTLPTHVQQSNVREVPSSSESHITNSSLDTKSSLPPPLPVRDSLFEKVDSAALPEKKDEPESGITVGDHEDDLKEAIEASLHEEDAKDQADLLNEESHIEAKDE
ncbi:hypothetical protein BN7_1742 [Wickerhamomyces ciferrii]|uniref:SMP-LTD domain-containing protein n=1 Tax=Wickerhamomyces ciferrii (strain ATCC 14091 / BCRC 22168 / CBS 111 / JCM 3599 / NBRC 0793 / NRRL Y-1031 F-60-10) TaxID=1206466 RepID=K0KM47_WICCF|nr:uncharacterized protein BN7_1742 [Wickerhamomyces ciferrii]CCH42198.1 hypothetical protein BN7_1742 [Wickerhamomyces ciferrii]